MSGVKSVVQIQHCTWWGKYYKTCRPPFQKIASSKTVTDYIKCLMPSTEGLEVAAAEGL